LTRFLMLGKSRSRPRGLQLNTANQGDVQARKFESMKEPPKLIVKIGWTLIALLLFAYVSVMLIAVIEGDGVRSIRPFPGGRGGTLVPIMLLPLVGVLVVVGLWWFVRRLRTRKRSQSLSSRSRQADDQ
jgi:hypothetical protein